MSDVRIEWEDRVVESQWQLSSIQLVNFGPFDGYHLFDVKCGFDEIPTTVVAGDSGTGKSTLEDAFFEVMTRNGSYNTASNEGGRGGTLSSEKRSLIGYVRGKLEDTEDEHGNPVAQLLRDGMCNRWSAVVITFESDAGTVFTVAKLFWIAAGYNANSDIKQLRLTMRQTFDPRQLEAIADVNFTAERVRRQIGTDFKSYARVDEFLTYVYRVLKIDELGQGKDVMDLLGKIRSGVGFRSIAELFREQVLDVPKTYDRAEEAAASYREHYDAWLRMKDKQERVDALTEIRVTSGDYDETSRDLMAHNQALTDQVFGAWERNVHQELLLARTSELTAEREAVERQLEASNAGLERATAQAADLERQLNATGFTERLAAFDASIARATEQERRANETFRDLAREVEPNFGKMPTSAREFDALKSRVEKFEERYGDEREKLEAKQAEAIARRVELKKKGDEIRADLAYYERNKSRIPRNLGEARQALADAAGLAPEDLPFAAELMEVTDERWRRAVESVYGGLARTLLVPSEDFERFSQQIDRLKLRKRMTFRSVPVDIEVESTSAQSMLSARLGFDEDSPFTGWLQNTVRDEHHDALCVGTPAQLKGEGRRVTINGQTRDGKRGAHGRDANAEDIIGLDNTYKVDQLRRELIALDKPWNEAVKAERDVRDELLRLDRRHAAAERIERYEFSQIDVLGARSAREVEERARQQFLDENEALGELEDRLVGARAEVKMLTKRVGSQEAHLEGIMADLGRVSELLGEVRRAMGAAETIDVSSPGYLLLHRMGAERFEGHGTQDNLTGFNESVLRVKTSVMEGRGRLTERVDKLEKRIIRQLEGYLQRWPDNYLMPALDCMGDFMALLDRLEREGFHTQKDSWREHMLTWIKEDLIPLDVAYRDARTEIDDKLEPINRILRTLPFGREGGRLEIVCKSADPKSARSFASLMRDLLDYERQDASTSEEAYHRKAERLMEIIAPKDQTAEFMRRRNEVLDRRRHVTLSARVVDANDPTHVLGTIKTLASKSGGEVAEIVAFILGAALLYRLGQDGTTKPGFAPVLLDEGFIKADSRFTSRAISAWQGFGFQLIIAVPEEKYQSVVSKAERVLNIVADSSRRSYVSTLDLVRQQG